MITFKDPLYLLILPVIFLYFYYAKKTPPATMMVSSVNLFSTPTLGFKEKIIHSPLILRTLSLALLILALGRPMTGIKKHLLNTQGIEMIICLDTSNSLKGTDLKPNRLEVAKKNIQDFINNNKNDKIGLVIFGKEAFLQCPLTLDHEILKNFLKQVDFNQQLGSATTIGMALTTAIIALKSSQAKTKLIILVTDGVNNTGDIDPITAAHLCETYGIKVYCIGIGKPGISQVFIEGKDPFFGSKLIPIKNEMDEETLKKISKITGGIYFNVQNKPKFKEAYQKINLLEKTKITSSQYLEGYDQYPIFLFSAFCLILLELGLSLTFLKKLP